MKHKRAFRGTVQTGPAPHVPPWKVEWVIGQSFKCFVGRVHDEDSIDNDSEFSQKRFSSTQQQSISISPNRMTSRTLNRNVTSMEKTAHSVAVKTGSSLIYTKTSRGRVTTPSTSVDDTLGYAIWAESEVKSTSQDTYFVLHKKRGQADSYDKWCLSVVNASDVVNSDIKIACFKYARGGSASRANLIQLWKSDIVPSGGTDDFPFKISVSGREISVATGTLNNKVTEFTSGEFEADDWRIYLRGSGWTTANPSTTSVMVSNFDNTSDNTYAYLLLGTVKIEEQGTAPNKTYTAKVTQFAGGSQWVDRFKCSSSGAPNYYWCRV